MAPTATKSLNQSRRFSLPIVARYFPKISQQKTERLVEMANRLIRDEPAFLSSRYFGELVRQEINTHAALIIGDQSEINLFQRASFMQLDYRMAALAQSGDTVIVSRRDKIFEQYLKKYLQIGDVNFISGDPREKLNGVSIAKYCQTEARMQAALRKLVTASDGLMILPYLTTGNIWRLAQQIGQDTQIPVGICGPSPRISTRTNDKIWFTDQVRQLIGAHAVSPTYTAYGPAAAAGHIARLRRISERIVIKIPDSAGSAGNIAIDSTQIADFSLSKLSNMLITLLHAKGWQDSYPILLGIWECNVFSSPSVQLWIPLEQNGPPIVEGVIEQIVVDAEGEFVGARPAVLPEPLEERLVEEAFLIASLFQKLGYFGRCSLDSIISPKKHGDPDLHWIECNARWGGASIPLTLANRLIEKQTIPGLVIVQQSCVDQPVHSTEQIIRKLEDMLFIRGTSRSGLVLLSPPDDNNQTWINFLAIGEDQKTAENITSEAIARLEY